MQRLFKTSVFSRTHFEHRCREAYTRPEILQRPSIFYFYKKPVVFSTKSGTEANDTGCHDIISFNVIQGIGNSVLLGAVVTTLEMAQLLTHRSYFNAFGGNPVCTSAGHAILRVLEKEKLQENAFALGSYLKECLDFLKEMYESDVRGRGLILGVEHVTDRHLKTPAKTEILHDMEQMKGNCWAFSKKPLFESEQELVDCDNIENQGCNGGLMESELIKQNGSITTDENYLYTEEDGTCDAHKEDSHAKTSVEYVENTDSDEAFDFNEKGLNEAFDFNEKDLESDESMWDLYERWQRHYGVARDQKEKQKRFKVFKKNAKEIYKFNKKEKSWKQGLNMFGDMTWNEFEKTHCSRRSSIN